MEGLEPPSKVGCMPGVEGYPANGADCGPLPGNVKRELARLDASVQNLPGCQLPQVHAVVLWRRWLAEEAGERYFHSANVSELEDDS